MTLHYFEVQPQEVEEDRSVSVPDEGFVFEHLRRYCSEFDPLPAIIVQPTGGKLFVTRGHLYLRIARDLKRSSIRAVCIGHSYQELASTGVRGLIRPIAPEVLQSETEPTVRVITHVFFLGGRPTEPQVCEIDGKLRQFEPESVSGIP